MQYENKKLFIIEPIVSVSYMIEAQDDAGEFMESDDGSMVNLFWSNEDGWVPYFLADVFGPEEYLSLDLPLGGSWVEVSKVLHFVASNDSFVINEVSKLNRNPDPHPDGYEDESYYRVV
jgi:hypothetical protein